jgi:sulfite exporter TauE/SafE
MMSWPLALGILSASLLGSAHCAGMCGGFVCFYSAGASGRAGGSAAHAAYNGGRLLSYLTLGALAGLLGRGIERIGALNGVSRAAAVLSGTLMVGWGLSTLLASRGVRLPRLEGMSPGRNPLGALLHRVRDRSPIVRAGATGLLTTLLPCGWLYAFVFAAAGTGRVSTAMATMALFWAGTLPVMLGVGYGAQRLTGAFRTRLPMVTAAAVVVMGVLSITGRLRIDPEKLAARAAQMQPTLSPSGASVPADGHQH